MAEKDALSRVCLEPLLYSFQAPRTIAATLCEYEHHLRQERALSPRRVRSTIRTLERFLDPIEAPLVALTRELGRMMVKDEEERQQQERASGGTGRCLTLPRTRRFFRWAVKQGYVACNPFEEFEVGVVVASPTSWPA